MLEVRYVLSLEHHDISIYGGGEHIPDGELFIKRNALCLTRKTDVGEMTADGIPSKPFFLFADNTSDKEDFYFAMLKNQTRKADAINNPPVPLQFDIKNMIGLVQRLHSSEEHLQTRWLNAMLGRIFLSLYRTTDVENWVRAKITKKISRVKKPSFLSGIVLRDVDMGEGAPLITNPRLKDLTVEGDCTVEADLRYTGNFRLEVAAIARIDLGTRFKAREVKLLLAVVFKKIEGHVFARIKPPPSNRIWLTFSQPPKIEMSIEPIVSSRQITYTLILRQIENRIKEVIAESIVMPYWDDIAFYSTEGKRWRGGIWVDDTPTCKLPDLDTAAAAEDGDVDEVEQIESEVLANPLPTSEKSMSVPTLEVSQATSTYSRKTARSLFNLTSTKATASSSSVDTSKSHASEKPRALRHGSFTSVSSPIVAMDTISVDAFKAATPPEHNDAASAMAAISARSYTDSPTETPLGSPPKASGFKIAQNESSTSTEQGVLGNQNTPLAPDYTTNGQLNSNSDVPSSPVSISESSHHPDSLKSSDNSSQRKRLSSSSTKSIGGSDNSQESNLVNSLLGHGRRRDSLSSTKSISSTENQPTPSKRIMLSTVANAAATARRWGINALQRNGDQGKGSSTDRDDAAAHLSQPMGRGRPLPPPGVPLPPPDRKTPTAPIPVPKRKPLPPPVLPKRPQQEASAPKEVSATGNDEKPPLPKRGTDQGSNIAPGDERGQEQWFRNENVTDDGILVVAAPPDSEPTTPIGEARQSYMQPWVDDYMDGLASEEA